MKTVIILFLSAMATFASDRDRYQKQYAFIDKYAYKMIEASKQNPNLLPSVALAQAIVETGYGKSTLYKRANNLYGIKYTSNCKCNKYYTKAEGYFRAYSSPDRSIKDRYNLLTKSKRYHKVLQTRNAHEQVDAIAKAGYAEAGNYAVVLKSVIDKFNLTQYDLKLDEEIAAAEKQKLQQMKIEQVKLNHNTIDNAYAVRSTIADDPIRSDIAIAANPSSHSIVY
jgi:flagellum-specific peptidoglycan hydrolase FlgJ